jgi:hypothetical protein
VSNPYPVRCLRNSGENGAHLLGRSPDRGTRSGGVLDQNPGFPLYLFQCLGNGFGNAARGCLPVSSYGGSGMKADPTHPQSRGALQLLSKTGPGPSRLGRVFRSSVENVRRVHDNMLRGNSHGGERRSEPLDPIRLHGRLVTVVLRRRGEDLKRLHAGSSRPKRGHADASIGYRMSPQISRHCFSLP